LSGDRFFYGNPLASTGTYGRSEWFGTACCPSNISRLIASLGDYIYAKSNDALWVNLFVGSNTSIPLKGTKVNVRQETNYPWDGANTIYVSPDKKAKFKLNVRIPGWVQETPVPGDTYKYLTPAASSFQLSVNGKQVPLVMHNGYAVIERVWTKNDVVRLMLPMEVRRIVASDSVKENVGRVSLQRGPLVYCFEHVDNDGQAMNIILPDNAPAMAKFQNGLLGGVMTIQCDASVIRPSPDGTSVETVRGKITAIPYFTWANRGAGQMQVWLPRKATNILVR
jgi:DUF1680 family protein